MLKKINLSLYLKQLKKYQKFFNSKSYLNFNKVDIYQIQNFLKQNKIEFKYKEYNGQVVLKYCPLCEKPHKDLNSNMWTLNIKSSNGVYLCFRCG